MTADTIDIGVEHATHAIEWTHIESGDIGLRAADCKEAAIAIFPNRREALAECCRLNEHSTIYRYRPIPHDGRGTPGLKLGAK